MNRSPIRRAKRLSKFGQPLTEQEREQRALREARQQEEDLRLLDNEIHEFQSVAQVTGERSSRHAQTRQVSATMFQSISVGGNAQN